MYKAVRHLTPHHTTPRKHTDLLKASPQEPGPTSLATLLDSTLIITFSHKVPIYLYEPVVWNKLPLWPASMVSKIVCIVSLNAFLLFPDLNERFLSCHADF